MSVQTLMAPKFEFDEYIEAALTEIEGLLAGEYVISKRAIGLLLLQDDPEVVDLVREKDPENIQAILGVCAEIQSKYHRPLNYAVTMQRQALVDNLVEEVVAFPASEKRNFGDRLSQIMMHPILGVPILLTVLYFGLYRFVGGFGAGTMVNFFEGVVFGEYINPWMTDLVTSIIPWPVFQELFVGDYGIITLGVRYAVAIILPIVATFFIVFSIIEDSGYFPRLAMLIDRLFKSIGLNGRAVIPMVLGLGCDTMATMVTRVLETKRERIIATLLLSLAIPCSAQLGVILAMLSQSGVGLLIWGGVIGGVFLLIGFLSSKVLPGEKPSFYMELPPLRFPSPMNVITKTYTRMEWYFLEIFPLFIAASVVIWLGRITGLFQLAISSLEPVVGFLGLPKEAAFAFLFGFFRRDYGAAGLLDLQQDGGLTVVQMIVASVTLTLFVPCIAQFSMMLKERGWKTTMAMVAFIVPFAFGVGFVLNFVLTNLGVTL